MEIPEDWVQRVNQPQNEKQLEALSRSVRRGRPYGTPEWRKKIAMRLGFGVELPLSGPPAEDQASLPTVHPARSMPAGRLPILPISDLSRFPVVPFSGLQKAPGIGLEGASSSSRACNNNPTPLVAS